jgi:hypothetical protein
MKAFRFRTIFVTLGAECSHCAAALADLLRQVRETFWLNVEIVAVSSRRVADQALIICAFEATYALE